VLEFYTARNISRAGKVNSIKKKIGDKFNQAADTYAQDARVQQEAARQLGASLKPWRATLPAGPILEIGCGTGFFTRQLAELFPKRSLNVTDLSSSMIAQCRRTVQHPHIQFYKMDAERELPGNSYAMICHNFVAQWFKDPAYIMDKMLEQIKPGGLMLAAFPGSNSFPEWKNVCEQLSIPYTANPLPDTEELAVKLSLGTHQIDFYEKSVTQEFNEASQFFHMLKKIGATAQYNQQKLDISSFRKLISYWNRISPDRIKITWHVVYLAVKKN